MKKILKKRNPIANLLKLFKPKLKPNRRKTKLSKIKQKEYEDELKYYKEILH